MSTEFFILVAGYLEQTLTEKEEQQLFDMIATGDYDHELSNILRDDFKMQQFLIPEFTTIRERNYSAIQSRLHLQANKYTRPAHRVHFLKTAWFRYAAAIILFAGIGAYLWNNNLAITTGKPEVAEAAQKDVQPGSNRAMLTLSNGQKVELDNSTSETINDGSLSIENNNGRLIYDNAASPQQGSGSESTHGEITYNTMSTPRGGQYQLTLPDGSKVWLNAASSIRFPTVFTDKERIVSITGEVYFEITKNKQKPFIAKTPTEDIQVLGTSFNVNAYTDESGIKTSLVEGSVKITSGNKENILQPGQAFINGKIIQTNIDQDIAWKRGVFQFDHSSVAAVLRQVSRWYDIDVVYENKIPAVQFSGKLSRELTLKQIIKVLNDMQVNCEIRDNKTLIIH